MLRSWGVKAFSGILVVVAAGAGVFFILTHGGRDSSQYAAIPEASSARGVGHVASALNSGLESSVSPHAAKGFLTPYPSSSSLGSSTSNSVDPSDEQLKQGSWFGQVQEGIRKAEHNITWQDKCVVEGAPGGLHAANRANNLRAYFREDGIQIVERETSDPDWDVRWQFRRWGRDGAMRDVTEVKPTSDDNTNRVTFAHPGIEEWFVNGGGGLER